MPVYCPNNPTHRSWWGAKFCAECGKRLRVKETICKDCGRKTRPPGEHYCTSCGGSNFREVDKEAMGAPVGIRGSFGGEEDYRSHIEDDRNGR